MDTDWTFLVLTMVCALYLAKLVLDYSQRLGDIRPRNLKAEMDWEACNRQISDLETEVQQLKETNTSWEMEIKNLEGKKKELTQLLQDKTPKEKRPKFKL